MLHVGDLILTILKDSQIIVELQIYLLVNSVHYMPSFRGRLNISDENNSIASRIISDTIAAKYIKLDDAVASSKKYARYVPFWV